MKTLLLLIMAGVAALAADAPKPELSAEEILTLKNLSLQRENVSLAASKATQDAAAQIEQKRQAEDQRIAKELEAKYAAICKAHGVNDVKACSIDAAGEKWTVSRKPEGKK